MFRTTGIFSAVIIIAMLAIGCSGNGSPVTPSSPADPAMTSGTNHTSQASDSWLMGYYDVYFDLETRTFEAELNRSVSFTLNIVPFLNLMQIPKHGITFGSIVIHDDDPTFLGVDVEFSVHHPFPGLAQYDAYDMRGVVIGNGAKTLAYDGIRVAEHGVDLWLKNPDGYTRWFNPIEFTTDKIFGYCPGGFQNLAGDANVNPYKYYSKHLGKDDNLWSYLTGDNNWDGIFESGTGRTMEIEFPLPPDGIGLMFGYAVVVTWEEQGPTGPYHPVHCPEPVAASVNVTPDIWYNEIDGSGGDLILDIDLFAWEAQPSVVKIESSVLDSIYEFGFDTYAGSGGEQYSTWHVEAPSAELNSNEGHYFWVIAECSAYDYKNGLPDIPSSDGTLAAFFRYDLEVGTEPFNSAPVCVIESDPEVPYSGPMPVTITFDASSSYDPNPGDTILYEWSTDGLSWTPQSPTDVTYEVYYDTDGYYSIYLRLTDNLGAQSECSIIDFLVEYELSCEDITVTSANPASMESGEDYTGVEIFGEYFFNDQPMEVDLVDGVSVLASATNVVWMSSTELTCDISMCGVSPGDFQLRVKNGCEPESFGYLDYSVDPDPLKNIDIRPGYPIRDLSVCHYSNEPFVIFDDGQVFVYDENYSDYQSNTGTGHFTTGNLIAAQRPYDDPPTVDHAYPTIGSNDPGIGGFRVYYRDTGYFFTMSYEYVLDVIGMYANSRHYSFVNNGNSFTPVRKNLAPTHGGFWGSYVGGCGAGDGLINKAAVVGVDLSHTLDSPPNPAPPYSGYVTLYWLYFLENGPDYSVERCHYCDHTVSGSVTHIVVPNGTFLNNGELLDPQDICADQENNVFILDIDNTGQAVIKIYDEDLNYIGVVGDAVSISGDPLRIDNDDSTQSVHVAHTDGVSIFRKCELPI